MGHSCGQRDSLARNLSKGFDSPCIHQCGCSKVVQRVPWAHQPKAYIKTMCCILLVNNRRIYMIVVCATCGKEFKRKPSKVLENNYCSKSCSNIGKQTGIAGVCATCGKPIWITQNKLSRSMSGKNFCSRSCATSTNNSTYKSMSNHPNWADLGTTYRAIAFKTLPKVCNRCGYCTIPGVLQVHHKDRNRTNSAIENLEVLCPTCHAIEHYV